MTTMQTTGTATTTTPLGEVLDVTLLAAMRTDGYVRAQAHPHLPLTIYNYTEKAAYENVWNDATPTGRVYTEDTA